MKVEVVAIFEVEANGPEDAKEKVAGRLSKGLSLLPEKVGVLLAVIESGYEVASIRKRRKEKTK